MAKKPTLRCGSRITHPSKRNKDGKLAMLTVDAPPGKTFVPVKWRVGNQVLYDYLRDEEMAKIRRVK